MMHLNEHFIYLLAWYKFLILISMLVWCMLIICLNDESNVDSIKSQFISLCKGCHQLKKGDIESSSLVLVN